MSDEAYPLPDTERLYFLWVSRLTQLMLKDGLEITTEEVKGF